jgi:hypothetical protein
MKPLFYLSTVAIENFKAVCRSGTVEISPLTVFIGNNGSGKSSLIEGLAAYQETVTHGLNTAMGHWLGFEHVWNKRARHKRRHIESEVKTHENLMVFVLTGRVLRGSFTARMAISTDPGMNNGVRIESEIIKLPGGRLVRRDRDGHASIYRAPEYERKNNSSHLSFNTTSLRRAVGASPATPDAGRPAQRHGPDQELSRRLKSGHILGNPRKRFESLRVF